MASPRLLPLGLGLLLGACQPAITVTGQTGGQAGGNYPPRVDPTRADAGTSDPAPAPPPIVLGDAGAGDTVPAPRSSACPAGAGPQAVSCAAMGAVIAPEYAPHYTCFDLGPAPGVPMQKYGGLTLTQEPCSETLLIGGEANFATGKLYEVKVVRDGSGHISGFSGNARVHTEAPFNDGGITFGPGGVLFFARYPSNVLQQTKPGSGIADKTTALTPLGIPHSSASIGFVPQGLPGAGAFKLMTWPGGQWHTIELAPDGMGTFNLGTVKTGVVLDGGPEGFVYVAAGSPMFSKNSLLVSEWTDDGIATYETDEAGDPIVATRKTFMTGFKGAEGAYRDPATGDFFFSTWGQNNADRVIVVRGFRPITID